MIRSRLRALLASRGLSMAEVAQRTGISRSTLYTISDLGAEHATSGSIRLTHWARLAEFFGIHPTALFRYDLTYAPRTEEPRTVNRDQVEIALRAVRVSREQASEVLRILFE